MSQIKIVTARLRAHSYGKVIDQYKKLCGKFPHDLSCEYEKLQEEAPFQPRAGVVSVEIPGQFTLSGRPEFIALNADSDFEYTVTDGDE